MTSVTEFFDSLVQSNPKVGKKIRPIFKKLKYPKPKEIKINEEAIEKESLVEDENNEEKKNKVQEENQLKAKRTLFVNRFPYIKKVKKVIKFFSKYGEVESVRYRNLVGIENGTPKHKIFQSLHTNKIKEASLFVVFKDDKSIDNALNDNGPVFNDHVIQYDTSDYRKESMKHSVFVGNLSFDTKDEDLWNYFKSCGNVIRARVMVDPTGSKGRGCGYVSFNGKDSRLLALKLDQSTLKDRQIRVRKYRLKKNK